MLKLNSNILGILSRHYAKHGCRNNRIQFRPKSELSVRQRQRQIDREIYKSHPNILYSSHLEYSARNILQPKESPDRFMPNNWMEDYEFYEGDLNSEGDVNSSHGTSDPNTPPSKVPCSGCGASLHCVSSSIPGYIPMEIFKGRSDKELQTIVCQRCHFLKNYNIALDVEVSPESYIETISSIKNEFALAIVIVDLLDFPSSIWPGMQELLGSKRPVFVVGNKVDLLPRDSDRYLEHIKKCLEEQMINSGFDKLNIKYINLISAKTGYGIEELITQLHKIWKYKGNVYLMGCTNVGKSSLFNILLNSDYCRPQATSLVRKATTCPWPGTTLQMLKFPIYRPSEMRVYQRFRRLFSERAQKWAEEKLRRNQAKKTGSIAAAQLVGRVGRSFDAREDVNDPFASGTGSNPIITLNERSKEFQKARWCYDTPGVMHPDQITNLLTTEELLKLPPSHMINPRAFRLEEGLSLFLAGLGRLDFIEHRTPKNDWIKVFLFSSLQLPVTIVPTKDADRVYNEYLGTQFLAVPIGSEERLAKWPGLQSKETITVQGTDDGLSCDVTLSSAGWIGLSLPEGSEGVFKAWTPFSRGIHIRKTPLIPYAHRLIGKRIRNSLAYNLGKPFTFGKR